MTDELLICDLTQSWSPSGGGGITTYLQEKRKYFLDNTPHRLLQIVPGPEDKITRTGRHIMAEIGSGQVWGSPNYRWINRNSAVFDLLREYQPDIIESLCPWVLPWLAIRHRWRYPQSALVAGYRTDFPNAHVDRVATDIVGRIPAKGFKGLSLLYAWLTYQHFDRIYTLNRSAIQMFAKMGIKQTGVLPLGVDVSHFSPSLRDPNYRASLGLPGDGPLLIYAGRIDTEKASAMLIEMFKLLPQDLGAAMVMLGTGKLRGQLIEEAKGLPIVFPGYESDRGVLSQALASADIYVSAMAYETFGMSVLEAQASGLPVIGVDGGAMPERVPPGTGLIGPVGDAQPMADNIVKMWRGDHAAMKAASLKLASGSNRWSDTFEQLINVEYVHALETRDARTGRHPSRIGAIRRLWPTK